MIRDSEEKRSRPVVIGYLQERPGITAAKMHELQGRMIRLALSRGMEIQAIFIERLELGGIRAQAEPKRRLAFHSALDKLNTNARRFLIIPSIDHLEHLTSGGPRAVVEAVSTRGIEVLIVA